MGGQSLPIMESMIPPPVLIPIPTEISAAREVSAVDRTRRLKMSGTRSSIHCMHPLVRSHTGKGNQEATATHDPSA